MKAVKAIGHVEAQEAASQTLSLTPNHKGNRIGFSVRQRSWRDMVVPAETA